jgi:hypothetical protein
VPAPAEAPTEPGGGEETLGVHFSAGERVVLNYTIMFGEEYI